MDKELEEILLEKTLINDCIKHGGTFMKKRSYNDYVCGLMSKESPVWCRFQRGFLITEDDGIFYRCGLADYLRSWGEKI